MCAPYSTCGNTRPAIASGCALACVSATSRWARIRSSAVGGKRRVQQHVRHDVERRRELAAGRYEADRAALAADRRRDRRAEQLERIRQRFAITRLRPLAHHRRRQAGDAGAIGRLELSRAAEKRDAERDERQVVLLRDDEVGAVGERGPRPRGHAQVRGACPDAGVFVRSNACRALTPNAASPLRPPPGTPGPTIRRSSRFIAAPPHRRRRGVFRTFLLSPGLAA